MSSHGVALFHSTSAALRSEKVLKKAGFAVKLIPVPREFSSDCGVSLRFDWCEADNVTATLAEARVEVAGVHPL